MKTQLIRSESESPPGPTGLRGGNGFTLIELLVVIAIIVLLAATIIGLLINARKRAENERCRAAMNIVYSALDIYKETHGNYPKIDSAFDEAKRNNLLLRELFMTTEYSSRGGLKRRSRAALADPSTIAEFIGDSDGDWDPSQPLLNAEDVLVDGVEILDPWGQPFIYKFPGIDHSQIIDRGGNNSTGYDLYSIGRNGIDDYDAATEEDTDDWTNWAKRDQADD